MPSSIVLNGTTGIANATWTTATRPASPVAGQSGYNTTIGAMETYTGSTWSTSDLPAPSTAGNVLTSNGTSWTSATLSVAGGATSTSISSNLTLTSSSNRVQNISATTSGLSVTLPDATTISTGGPVFYICNTGTFSININLSGGNTVYALNAGQSIELKLVNNSTASGVWNLSNPDISIPMLVSQNTVLQLDSNAIYTSATTASYGLASIATNSAIWIEKLTSTTALAMWIRSSNNSVYGCVITNTSGTLTAGTVTLIYNGSTTFATQITPVLLTNLTNGLCVVSRPTNAVAIPFTISGTTITVGTTSSTFGVAVTYDAICTGICAMSSTVAFISYCPTTTGTAVVNTLTHNGASAPTLGTASATFNYIGYNGTGTSGNPVLAYLTPTTAFLYYLSSSTQIYASGRVVTLNGTSAPTLGTATSALYVAASNAGPLGISNQCIAYSATEVFTAAYSYQQISQGTQAWTVSGTTVTYVGASVNGSINTTVSSGVTPTISGKFAYFGSGIYLATNTYNALTPTPATSYLWKWTYVSGIGIMPNNYYTPFVYPFVSLQNVCSLSATTGILVGIDSSNTPNAAFITLL